MATKITLHLISHTHWDREWYRTFQQFRLMLVQLIDDLLSRLATDPGYRHFMLDGQTIVLEDYLAIRPEREAELRRFIQEGRLIIGPWHLLPDEFLVSPEALIRNLLEGERVAHRFGPIMKVGYIPDPFGHIGQMPQLLHGFGIDAACLWRGVDDQPCECWWQAPDGSRVLLAYLRESYSNAASLPTSEPARFTTEINRLRDTLSPFSATGQIILMHGTDHMPPPVDTTQAIAYAQRKLGQETLIHSSLPDAIAAIKKKLADSNEGLPTLQGELRSSRRSPLLPNVLSSRMWIKQRNHACQTLFEKWAEPFSTWAALLDPASQATTRARLEKPTDFIRHAWRLLLECHPHDSICGCSIDPVHDEMVSRFNQVEQLGEELTRLSLQTMVGVVNTTHPSAQELTDREAPQPVSAIVVFNPLEELRTDLVSVEIQLPPKVQAFEIVDEGGHVLPYQVNGIEGRELINVTMSRQELVNSIGMVHAGRVMGMVVREFSISRKDSLGRLEMVMSDEGQPDLEAWELGMDELNRLLTDPSVTHFSVLARSIPATRIQFIAPAVPSIGYRTFWVRAHAPAVSLPARPINPLARAFLPLAARLAQSKVGGKLISHLSTQPKTRPPFIIENEFLIVEASPKDGTLTLTDKSVAAEGREVTTFSGLNRFVDGGDCGDEYNFCPPAEDRLVMARMKGIHIHHGAIAQVMDIDFELILPVALSIDRQSRSSQTTALPIRSQVRLLNGSRRVDIHTEVENGAHDHRLRVHFPIPFEVKTADFDGHFEVLRRPIDLPISDETWAESPRPERPQRAFVDVVNTASNPPFGLMLANRGLPEVAVTHAPSGGAEIELTLLRCVGWLSRDDLTTRKGHAGPEMPTPGAQMPGLHTFDYSLIPHTGSWDTAHRQAYAFNTSLRAVGTDLHTGDLSNKVSFISLNPSPQNNLPLVISSVKSCEDNTGWIVRGVNLSTSLTQARLTPWRRFGSAERVRIDEKGGAPLSLEADGSVTIPVRAGEIFTVKFNSA